MALRETDLDGKTLVEAWPRRVVPAEPSDAVMSICSSCTHSFALSKSSSSGLPPRLLSRTIKLCVMDNTESSLSSGGGASSPSSSEPSESASSKGPTCSVDSVSANGAVIGSTFVVVPIACTPKIRLRTLLSWRAPGLGENMLFDIILVSHLLYISCLRSMHCRFISSSIPAVLETVPSGTARPVPFACFPFFFPATLPALPRRSIVNQTVRAPPARKPRNTNKRPRLPPSRTTPPDTVHVERRKRTTAREPRQEDHHGKRTTARGPRPTPSPSDTTTTTDTTTVSSKQGRKQQIWVGWTPSTSPT